MDSSNSTMTMEPLTESNSQPVFTAPTKLKKNPKLSPAEQILAGSNHQHHPSATYTPTLDSAESFFNSYFLTTSDVANLSRSMTSLTLSTTIPEDSVQFQSPGKLSSKSAIDLVGLTEEQQQQQQQESFNPTENRVFSFQVNPSPSRCLLINHLSPVLTEDQLRPLLEGFGELHSLNTEYRLQGLIQVIYYDLRSAVNAKDQLNGLQIVDQYLTVDFGSPLGGSRVEGTLLVQTIDPGLDAAQIIAALVPFGDVRQVQIVPNNDQYRLVEFYDIRHSKTALNQLNLNSGNQNFMKVGLKQTLSSQNLNSENPVLPEDQDLASLDNSGQILNAGLTRSLSFGSGLSEKEESIKSAEFCVFKGAVLATPQLLEQLRITDQNQINQNFNSTALGSQLDLTGLNFGQMNQTGSCFDTNGGTSILQTLAAAQVAGLNIYEVLSKLPGVNLAQILASGCTNNGYSTPSTLFSAPGFCRGTGFPNPALIQSPGLDLTGTLFKSASSPVLRTGQGEDREGGGGRLSRRNIDPVIEAERRAQQQRLYALDLEKIKSGEDKRTTLMIKNIPNKYTQKMLLASIDETLKGTYDFFYLPIDFKNKCNVGYGFINMREPGDIVPLVERFHDRKWGRFNSEKVCCVAFGRIQGKQALINHFQNSSLMHEDKKHRPVLFVTDGPNKGDPEPFPVGSNIRPKITIKDRDFRSRDRNGGH